MNRYYSKSVEELFTNFRTSDAGLNNSDASRRLEKYGFNTIPRKEKESLFVIFIKEIFDPIVLLLFLAALFSFFTGEIIDGIGILIIIFIDLIIGTYEENKANTTVEALASLVPEKVKVDRDGKEVLIDSKDLTIGDYVYLESGDKISADLRLVEAHNFTVDESILTGESVPVTTVVPENAILV